MDNGSARAGGDAGERRPIAIGFARGAGILNLLPVVFDDRGHLVIIVVTDDLQDTLGAGRGTRTIRTFDARVRVNNKEVIPRAVLIAVMRFQLRFPPETATEQGVCLL